MAEEQIKKLLLKEASDRLTRVKISQFDKTAMGLYSGQGDMLNSNNTSYHTVPMDEESRITRIKQAIEDSFGHYLRSRLVDPQTGQRSTRLTAISPGVGEQLSSGQPVPIIDDNILAVDRPQGFEFDSGFRPGHLYFRYRYSRDLMPTRNAQHMERANGFLAHFHQLGSQTVPGDGPLCPSCASPNIEGEMCSNCGNSKSQEQTIGLINLAGIIRKNNIALLSYFNTRNAGNDPSAIPPSLARQYISEVKAKQPTRMQSAYGEKSLFSNIDLSMLRYMGREDQEKEMAYTVGKTGAKKVLSFPNTGLDLHDNLEKPSELNRQLFWKICSGYTLDEGSLDQMIGNYITQHMKNFPSGKDDRFLKGQQHEWQMQKRVMLRVFQTMEKRAPIEFKRAMNSWYQATEEVPDAQGYSKTDAPPTEGLNYQHGMPFYGSSKLLRCYISESGGEVCINFRSIHLKMLLAACTKSKPENYYKSTAIKAGARGDKLIRPDTYFPLPGPDEYTDPRYTVKSIPDGMSDALNPRMAREGMKEMGVPPLIKVPVGDGFEARLDRHNCNLGRKHLVKSGSGILNLLEWAEQTDWPRQAMARFSEAYKAGHMNTESAEIFKTLSEGTFGSDVFQYYMDMYGSDPASFLNQHMRVGMTGEENKFYETELDSEFPVDDRTLGLLRKHGPSISALMDMLYALMHRASNTSVKIQDKSGEDRIVNSFGQQYDGTSGAGGGGEVLMSIKFAYEATMEQLGSPEATDRWKKNIKGKDPQPRVNDVLYRQTDDPNLGQTPTMEPLDEGAEPDMLRPHIVQNLTFWVGQSSSIGGRGQRLPRMTTLWPPSVSEGAEQHQGKSWAEALDYFYLRYPQIAEDTGEVVFDMGINLSSLENRFTESFDKVRQELALENPITIETEFGTTELGSETTAPSEPVTEETIPAEPAPVGDPEVPGQTPPPPPPAPAPPQTSVPAAAPTATTPPPPPLPSTGTDPSKPMFQAPQSGFIGKDKAKRTLIKTKNRMHAETLVNRISRVATQFDERGEKGLADVFDSLLSYITKEKTKSKGNRESNV